MIAISSRRVLVCLSGVLLLSGVSAPPVIAEFQATDRILFESPSGSPRWVGCLIHDYTGKTITFQINEDNPPRDADASTVLRIISPQVSSHTQGLIDLSRREANEARKNLVIALATEARPWVQREILAAIVQASLQLGDEIEAVKRFLAIVRSDPTSRHVNLLPARWDEAPLTDELVSQARAWMLRRDDTADFANLIGSSYLLFHRDHEEDAKRTLRRLRISRDRRVQLLAGFQEARLEVRAANTPDFERLEQLLMQLPDNLRSGPRFVIARTYAVRQNHDKAVAMWLWIPLTNAEHAVLASESLFYAAESLQTAGDANSALTLHREVLLRFPSTPAAGRVRTARSSTPRLEDPSSVSSGTQ